MRRSFRTSLFIIFLFTFAVLAPAIVLYTAGFRLNIKNNTVQRTGVISVATNPRGATIFLGSQRIRQTSPHLIKRAAPGEYTITLSKDGFHSWTNQIEVVQGVTTHVSGVTLLQESTPEQTLLKKIELLVPAPSGLHAAFTLNEGGWRELWLFNAEQNEPILLDRVALTESSPASRITWSADSAYFSFSNPVTAEMVLFSRSGDRIDALSNFDESMRLTWHPSAANAFFVEDADEVTSYRIENSTINEIEVLADFSVDIDGRSISFVDNGNMIELRQTINGRQEVAALLPRGEYTLQEQTGSFLILTDVRGTVLLIDLSSAEPILFERRVQLYDWNSETRELAFSDGNEISVYRVDPHRVQFFTRQSDSLVGLSWQHGTSYLFAASQTELFAIETEQIGKRSLRFSLATPQTIEHFWLSRDGRVAFFEGIVEGAEGIYSLDLLASTSYLPFIGTN